MNELMNTIRNMITEEFSAISMADALLAIGLSFVLGLFVVLIYKVTYGGVCFSKSFAGCLIMLSMVTALVILVIASNVVLSLGMVGALSIVRFRTAVKDPADTAFLFWAVAAGITSGAGFYLLTLGGCVVVGLVCLLSVRYMDKADKPYLLVLRAENGYAIDQAEEKLGEEKISFSLSSRVETGSYTEGIYEVAVTDTAKVMALKEIPGVQSVSLVDCRKEA